MILKKGILIVFVLLMGSLNQAHLDDSDKDDLALTWANTKMAGMSVEEKIGQLFMIQAYSSMGQKHRDQLMEAVKKYHVGGLAFFQGGPKRQAILTQELQMASDIPMLVAIDAEWGLGMRLDSTLSFPRQFTLGAIQDNRLIYEMGREIGKQLKALGIHMNFAPVVDINSNPRNPVIGDRSFGESKKAVSRKSFAFMKGLQDVGVMACAKHFPGHGDTHLDSHKTLPTLNRTLPELMENELFPFKLLSMQGVKSVMVAHLQVPALDNRKNRPASLSEKIIRDLLREKMEYDGLILTDALGMRGVADHYKSGVVEVEAFLAGNDILTVSQSLPKAYKAMLTAVTNGRITEERLDESVLRILMAKFEAGLFFPPEMDLKKIDDVLQNPGALTLKEDLYRHAITYLKGKEGHSLPVENSWSKKVATLAIGVSEKTPFQKRVDSYTNAEHHFSPATANDQQYVKLYDQLKGKDLVLISFHELSRSWRRGFSITENHLSLIRKLQEQSEVYVVLFGSPYSLSRFGQNDHLIMAYDADPMAQDMAAQALFGSIRIEGKLPVSPGKGFKMGMGETLPQAKVLAYSLPGKVGLSVDTLAMIDLLVDTIIQSGAAPGCQVLVAKDGYIVYDKCFGYQTYDKKYPIRHGDLYDLASITKVMATTLSVMKLYEKGQIDIFDPISDYIDGFIDSSDKKDITIIEALTHHSGLKPWIPFYKMTLDTLSDHSIVPSASFYRRIRSDVFSRQVAKDLFIRKDYGDTIQKLICDSELRPSKDYKYSDLGLYLVKEVVETVSGKSLDTFVKENFYDPMNLGHIGFNPIQHHAIDHIVPTEDDDYFRMQELKGYVHDMGAAMLGGVSGHAGLFSNAGDLAVLMQMLLNKGLYGQHRYLNHKTIYTFTTRFQRSSRRAIGFDMKELDGKKPENMSPRASASTFGHYGFTGTCVFADPDNQLIYIFLSNRTFPSMENNKMGKEDYRSRIQDIVYRSLLR
jgi:beta-N-acetylhexosaminidase